ncbi:MAG: hypothetical protein KDC98_09390 [Planctomycetes bacterium]|nr:hypothetical protein [Planctomycetota bacterium]
MNNRPLLVRSRPAIALAAAVSVSMMLPGQEVAWAWVNPPGTTATFTPSTDYQYDTGGGLITVTPDLQQQNKFLVRVPNVPGRGVVQACAYSGSHTAVVESWTPSNGDVLAVVKLFNANGTAANNARFTFRYRVGGDGIRHEAYLWADQPLAASYTAPATTSYVSNGAAATIIRLGPGSYQVLIPGLGAQGEEFGNVQITPYNSNLVHAKVVQWTRLFGTDLRITVQCSNQTGVPTDSRFFLSYSELAGDIPAAHGTGGHVWADQPTAASYVPSPFYVDSNGNIGRRGRESISRLGTGRYLVRFPDLAPDRSTAATVCGYGPDTSYATIERWNGDEVNGTSVYVNTWSATGTPMDAKFSLSYLTNRPGDEVSWTRFSDTTLPQGVTVTTDAASTYTPSGKSITVQRDAITANLYHVTIPRTIHTTGAIHVTPAFGRHFAVVRGATVNAALATVVDVLLFTPTGGTDLIPRRFDLLNLRPADPAAKVAWRVCDHPTSPTNPPGPDLAWNGNRTAPWVVRTGPGSYNVRFYGLAPNGNEHGHVQVTPMGSVPRRANVLNWVRVGTDIAVNIECRDASGALADSEFVVSYHEFAVPMPERMGSGTHLWADNPTSSTYSPAVDYVDSNGTLGPANVEYIHRVATGTYDVTLPNVVSWDSVNTQLTAYGTGDHFAIIDWVGEDPGGGTLIRVKTYAHPATLVDSRFTLLHMTDRPAIGIQATNASYGTGCNGAILTALTRPVIGTDWDLRLVSVPAGTILAFVQLGNTDPNQLIGPQAPGCSIYTSGEASILVPLPIPVPAYSLAIPNVPALIGLTLRAQGGAFAPGINSLWLATSAGTRGVIGDV